MEGKQPSSVSMLAWQTFVFFSIGLPRSHGVFLLETTCDFEEPEGWCWGESRVFPGGAHSEILRPCHSILLFFNHLGAWQTTDVCLPHLGFLMSLLWKPARCFCCPTDLEPSQGSSTSPPSAMAKATPWAMRSTALNTSWRGSASPPGDSSFLPSPMPGQSLYQKGSGMNHWGTRTIPAEDIWISKTLYLH